MQFPENAILDLDDEPAAVAAFLLWAYDVPLPHVVRLLDILSRRSMQLRPTIGDPHDESIAASLDYTHGELT